MRRRFHGLVRCVSVFALMNFAPHAYGQGTPIGFLEEFALAEDRAATLGKLIPGTEEHFYYSCLAAEHARRFEEVDALLAAWIERHGRTQRVTEIENRRAILRWKQDPAGTAEHLRTRLGLSFGHQRETRGVDPELPTTLDPRVHSPAVLAERAMRAHPGTLDGFEDSALRGLAASTLDDARLVSLLQRLRTPDVQNLASHVVRQLRMPRAGSFGSMPIHRLLLLEQLDECAQRLPALLDDPQFVEAYLARLRPGPDVPWDRIAAAREAYLRTLENFVARLSPAWNSLKAHVSYHRLQHDLALGKPDEERFKAYLRLPRRAAYAHPSLVDRLPRGTEIVDAGRSFATGFDAIASDEALVRAYCEHFFVDAGTYESYAELLQGDWVRRVFAETKILYGIGDMQRWYALLDDPGYYERLRDRVEIRFAPTSVEHYGAADPVALDVEVKNAGTLLIKVFEIHTLNFHREQQREIDASIDLDGFVANEERSVQTEANPLRRTKQHLEFANLNRRGTWVIELIGNGLSSRALIEKGRLSYVQRSSSAGQLVRVLDERGKHLKDAALLLDGREFAADPNGEILLPWSTAPGTKTVILRHGEFSTLDRIDHRSEGYALYAAVHVEREALLPGRLATVVVRPRLVASGHTVPIGLLEEPRLTITAIDLDGIATSLDVPGIALRDDGESLHDIQVPEGLVQLKVSLRGRVQNLTQGAPVELGSSEHVFSLNSIDATPATHCALLGRTAAGYMLDVLGKDGEPKSDRAVSLQLQHRDYRDVVPVTLRTDERGRIALGALDGIATVTTAEFASSGMTWRLVSGGEALLQRLTGLEGEALRVPWPARYGTLSRANAGLLRYTIGVPLRDAFDRLSVNEGYLELRGLEAGDYELRLGDVDHKIEVLVTKGPRESGWALGAERRLELLSRPLLQVQSLEADANEVRVKLGGALADARVHVVATRYLPPYGAFDDLRLWSGIGLDWTGVVHAESSYHSGRAIGDEYRYILDRRLAKKYPGNLLRRPGLLLNPWALDEESTSLGGEGSGGGSFGGRRSGRGGGPAPSGAAHGGAGASSPTTFPNLAFLPTGARFLANLRADAQGLIKIPRKDLGPGQHVHVVALDALTSIYATIALAEEPLVPRPQHLAQSLDPAQRLAEQQKIEFIAGGGTAVIADRRVSKVESYGSLAEVHRLFRTLSGAEDLAEFAFVLRWPLLPREQQLELYSKHACHELHFFLYRRDRAFFDEIVRPYLANKSAKTFLDEWLLDADLNRYLESYAFSRLNTVERILLAQRLPGEKENVARWIRETLELTPPDLERESYLFRGALQGDALNKDGGLMDLAELETVEEKAGEGARSERRLRAGLEPKSETAAKKAADAPGAPPPAADAAPAEEMQAAKEDKNADDLKLVDELERRKNVRVLYRAPETTKRFVERNYWERRIEEHLADLIAPNAFWLEYATASDGAPFASPHFAKASTSFAEMMLALAVLDLPLDAEEPEIAVDGIQLTLRPKTPILLVRQEIAPAKPAAEGTSPILVSQNFYRLDDRYRYEGNEQRDNYVTKEFLIDVAYGAQVVVTNPTSSPRKLELLLQVPAGAVPVNRGFFTRGATLVLGAYSTQSIEYAFYFPGPGERAHYPVHVSSAGAFVAAAEPATFHVVVEPSAVDTTSWAHVSQNGTSAEVLSFLASANLLRLDLSKIAWRMHERGFFDAALTALRTRKHFDGLLWSYAVQHRDEASLREYLRHAEGYLATCGSALVAELVSIDPVERHDYQHVEFEPLFNARAHRFGRERTVLNAGVASQYLSLLDVLAHLPRLADLDWMSVTYYMVLQDRVEEALASFARVGSERVPAKLQYDYMRAYLCFYTGDTSTARQLAGAHKEHPVERWRALFGEVWTQLDEAEGKSAAPSDGDDRTRQQTDLAEREPALELAVQEQKIVIRYRNVARCRLSYFAMDVEFLFSTRPFVEQGQGSFAYVRPNRSDELELPAGTEQLTVDLPAEFENLNVWIELSGGGLVRRQPYYANSIAVRWIETYGQLQVTDAGAGKPVPKVYVKVYAREPGGSVRFHKDGYTDLRGRFDYASLSGEGAAHVERFAVLVLSDERGAVIRELAARSRALAEHSRARHCMRLRIGAGLARLDRDLRSMSHRAESATSTPGENAAGPPRSKRAALCAAALLILAHAVALVCLARTTGTTVDEPILLAGGRMILEQGWSDPYTRFQGPLPLYPNQLFTQGRTVAPFPDDETIFLGRLGLLPFALLASIVLFVWSRAAFGDAAGLLSLALWATHPMALGYGSLLAVDAAHAALVLLALYLAWRYLRAPGVAGLACASLAIGASLASKYLALLFVPAGFAAIALGAWRSGTGSAWRRAFRCGTALTGAGLLALLAMHASYGFSPGFAPRTTAAYESEAVQRWIEIPVLGHALATLPRPFLEGLDYQRDIAGKVGTTYFNGAFANGHPAYYVSALFWKSPEILCVALAAALVCAALRWKRSSSAARTAWLVAALATLVPLFYLSFWNALQIGIRYALPILPLLCLLAGSSLRRNAHGKAFLWPAAVFVLGTIELATAWPEMLGYYNRTSGGAALAWKRFADSNSDWGHLQRRGLQDLRERNRDFDVLKETDGPRFGRVALHVSDLVRPDPRDPSRSYSWLDALQPIDHAGAAWFLFDVSRTDLENASRTASDPRRRRDFAVALLGSDRIHDALGLEGALSAEERAIFRRIQALRRAPESDPLAVALELAELWSKLERHDLAAEALRDPRFAGDRRARARVIELLVAQRRRDEAIALLERDAELLSEEPHALLLFLLYGEVARYGDAIRFLEPRLEALTAPVRAEAERRLAEMRRLNAAGERYHQRR